MERRVPSRTSSGRGRTPRHRYTIAALLAGLLLLLGLCALHRTPQPPLDRVYTLAEVRAGLARAPAAWLGRSLLVRAVALPTSVRPWDHREFPAPRLVDTTDSGAGASLPLAEEPGPLLAGLRRLPPLARLIEQQWGGGPRWGRVAIYRVELRAIGSACRGPNCAEAVLVEGP